MMNNANLCLVIVFNMLREDVNLNNISRIRVIGINIRPKSKRNQREKNRREEISEIFAKLMKDMF